MKIIDGKLSACGLKLAIVKSRENSFLTNHLLDGAIEAYKMFNGNTKDLTIVNIPSNTCFCYTIKAIKDVNAIICLGAEQDTNVYYLQSLQDLAAANNIPVILGIAYGNLEDLVNKCGVKAGNLGRKAIEQAIELNSVIRQIIS